MGRIDQEAIAWFTRINGEPSPADQKSFEVWINKSPLHDEAYRRISSGWVDADLPSAMIASENATQLSGYLDAIGQVRKRRRARNAFAGIATALVAALVGFDVQRAPNVRQSFCQMALSHYWMRAVLFPLT